MNLLFPSREFDEVVAALCHGLAACFLILVPVGLTWFKHSSSRKSGRSMPKVNLNPTYSDPRPTPRFNHNPPFSHETYLQTRS